MKRLLYISTTRTVPDEATLRSILAVSRRNNAAVGVTGILLSGGRRFLQALEGPADAVDTVYRRIARDPRHFAIVLLAQDDVATRTFAGWNMGYRTGGSSDGANDVATIVSQIVAPITEPNLRAYLTSFATLHAAA